MNLTSKRMLRSLAACAGAFTLSAVAQDTTYYVSDNFEAVVGGGTTNGAENMLIGQYKCQPYGESSQYTNFVWYADPDDVSKLVAETQNYVGIRPIAGSTANLVLNLETNGKTLIRTNDFNATLDFVATNVYVDTLIKFTPSEDNPSLESMDSSVKAAVFVNVSSNLVIYHKDGDLAATMTDTGVPINPAQWYRLTIILSDISNIGVFQLYLNGDQVTTSAPIEGGWYFSASDELAFNAVAFQGTGMVDELVVAQSDSLPDGIGTPSATWLTLSFNASQVSVLTNGIAIADKDLVKDGTSVSILAKPWYQITDGGALLVNATTNEFTAGVITGLVGTVTGSNGQTNTVASAAFSSTDGLPTGFGGVSISSLMTWANANGVTPEGLTDAMLDDYLLNVAPGTDAGIEITSITHGEATTTIRIGATKTGVDFTTIYGVLNIWTADGLPGTFSALSRTEDFVISKEMGYIDVEIDNGTGSFIKADIDVTEAEGIP